MSKAKKLAALILTLAITTAMTVPALACCGRGGGGYYRSNAQHGYYCGYGANCGYSYCPYVGVN